MRRTNIPDQAGMHTIYENGQPIRVRDLGNIDTEGLSFNDFIIDNGICIYADHTITEDGKTRQATAEDIKKLLQFHEQMRIHNIELQRRMRQYVRQMLQNNRMALKENDWPAPPVTPCLCDKCPEVL
ncbi:hypothetical protein DdX_08262 [Ditylenchus destructor]|uniref:Uncharacterized protein n=1 Tax=Ditylenchus destructor TaxID=166010 RepID=A0AAD4R7L8_9BILA|nr:hypothetical protein DdX_08262 [Ditylenchus destructor]